MKITPSVIDAMVKAGCTPEQLAAFIRAADEDDKEAKAHRREKNRIYQQNHRARQQSKRLQSDVSADLFPDGLEGSPTPPPKTLNLSPPSSLRSSGDVHARMEFLTDFWPTYPNKVGKPDALKSWLKARQDTDLETIMAGLDRYVHKADDRPWCNPATWLNQQRWTDQPAAVVPRQQAPPPPRNGMLAALERSRKRALDDEHDGPTIEASNVNRDRYGASQGVFSLAPPKRE